MGLQVFPDGWEINKIGDFCQIRRGASPRPIHDFLSKEGIPWLKIADATKQDSRYIDSTNQYILEKGRPNTVMVKPGDLIVSNSATPGIPKFMRIHAGIHDGWLLIKPSKKVDKNFVYYLFLNERSKLIGLANGTIFKNLKTDIVRDYKVALPSLIEQEKISKVLMSIDSKIELNREMNITLETIGQAIFKRWFVDFEFPNQEGKPYRTSGGEMVYSEDLGKDIPNFFKVGNIYSLCDVINGFPFSSKHFNNNQTGKPLIRIRDLKTLNPEFYSTEEDPRMIEVKPGDVIAGMDAEFRPWIWLGDVSYLNQRLCMFKPKAPIHELFIYQIVEPLLKKEEQAKVGTTVIHLAKSDIDRWQTIIPIDAILASFSDLAAPLIERLIINSQEIRNLAKIRDLLLPRLLSGKIRVPLKEEIAGESLSV